MSMALHRTPPKLETCRLVTQAWLGINLHICVWFASKVEWGNRGILVLSLDQPSMPVPILDVTWRRGWSYIDLVLP